MPEPPSQPLVDIVLPTYGPVPYLGEALASAVALTYFPWRLTVVDNSPETGGARAALERYEDDPRVRYIATGGLSQAENWTTGFAAGDAPYIAMLHDDDLWDPGFLEPRVAGLEAHRACALVFSAYREIDARGRLVALHAPRMRAGVLEPAEFVPPEYERNVIPTQSVLYRRAAYDAVGGRFEPGSVYIDHDLWIRLAVRHPVLSLHVRDCSLRSHRGSVTTAFQNTHRNGELWLHFLDHAEAAVDQVDPRLLPVRVRRRRRAAALVTVAGDELLAGHRDKTVRLVRAALRLHPPALLDARVAVLLGLLAAGPRAGRYLAAVRRAKIRWNIPTTRQDVMRRGDDLRLRVRVRARTEA